MKYIAEAVAFCALIFCCTWLEVSGVGAKGLWALVVVWSLFGF